CTLCNKGLCPGGYNCRNGSINNKSKICYEDLIHGNCKKNNCLSIHLTNRGLIPYIKQKNKDNNKEILENKYKYIDNYDKYNKKKYKNETKEKENNNKNRNELSDIKGILLTEKFLISHFGKSLQTDNTSSDSDNEEDVEKIIKFLNDDNENNSDEESI